MFWGPDLVLCTKHGSYLVMSGSDPQKLPHDECMLSFCAKHRYVWIKSSFRVVYQLFLHDFSNIHVFQIEFKNTVVHGHVDALCSLKRHI
jgi:hypothetical protein